MADEATTIVETGETPEVNTGSTSETVTLTPEQELESNFDRILSPPSEQVREVAPDEPVGEPETVKSESETADHRKDLPEDMPTNADWKRMRLRLKAAEENAKQQPAVPEAPAIEPDMPYWAVSGDPVKNAPEVQQAESVDPKLPFEVLARYASGDDKVESFVEAAKEHIMGKMTPQEILGVLKNARQGGYGELSADIASACTEWLPVVSASIEERKIQESKVKLTEQTYRDSWRIAKEALPDLVKPDSEGSKEFLKASQTLSKTFGINGAFFKAIPNGPQVVAEYVQLSRAANEVQAIKAEMTKLKEENRLLKIARNVSSSPQQPRQSAKDGTGSVSPENALADAFRQAGIQM